MYKQHYIQIVLLFIVLVSALWTRGEPVNDHVESTGLNVSYKTTLKSEHAIGYVNVEGRSVPVILDTCATLWLTLFTPTCEQLGINILKQEGKLTVGMVRVGMDEKGTLSEPREVSVIDAPQKLPGDGVMGWAVLSLRVWELDYPGQRQVFHQTLPAELVEGWVSFPIVEVPMGVLAIEVPIADQKQLVYIDTGAGDGVALNESNWQQWRDQSKPDWVTLHASYKPSSKTGFEVSETAVTDHFHLGDLDLGQVLVKNSQAAVALTGETVDMPIVLGYEAFRQRRVIIDGPGKRVYFGPLTEAAKDEAAPEINRAQATFIPDNLDGGDMFAHVIEDGVAHRAGLRDGDKILLVDGQLARNWKIDTAVRPSTVFNRAPGTRVRLIVEREGERLTVIIELGRSPLDPPADDKAEQP